MLLLLILCDVNLTNFRAATLWHHDHAVGITSENVYDGVFLSSHARDRLLGDALHLPYVRMAYVVDC